MTWEEQFSPSLIAEKPAIDENEFSGIPAPLNFTGQFPSLVPSKVKEITLSINKYGQETRIPALEIKFQITSANIKALANYFGTGYSSPGGHPKPASRGHLKTGHLFEVAFRPRKAA
jgi:hypothetical protein